MIAATTPATTFPEIAFVGPLALMRELLPPNGLLRTPYPVSLESLRKIEEIREH
jgi:hypothetical protein